MFFIGAVNRSGLVFVINMLTVWWTGCFFRSRIKILFQTDLLSDLFEQLMESDMITPKSSFTVFIVENLFGAKTFYSSYFNFTVAFENEWYLHLVSESGIQIGFMLPDQPTQPTFFHQAHNGKGVIFSLEVDNAESAYSEAKRNSLDITLDLVAEEWGQYHFVVKDPNGLFLDIVQSIEPTEQYQDGYQPEK